jgi:NAD(P)-dependent dehydrogenase (short-subunit alcohol dehydrogenase family)
MLGSALRSHAIATTEEPVVRQRIIITAAAAGIGRSVAAAFVAAGSEVQICDVDPAAVEAFRHEFRGVGATVVDLQDARAVDSWLDAAVSELGGIDVLVNNAGTKGPTAFVEDVELDEWRQCLAVSLDSHFLCARRVAPMMKAQGHGSIINMSSMAGMVGYGMRTPYAAAKWAVIGLTKSLAIELGPHGVRCNCICPGSVSGERIERVIAAEAEQRARSTQAVAAEYVAGQSIKRFVEPNEIADLCVFLASPAAAMITGQAIAIDGHSETYHL